MTQQTAERIANFIVSKGPIADRILKGALILIAIYLACSIGVAFLHGGAVDRILGAQ